MNNGETETQKSLEKKNNLKDNLINWLLKWHAVIPVFHSSCFCLPILQKRYLPMSHFSADLYFS